MTTEVEPPSAAVGLDIQQRSGCESNNGSN